MNQPAEPITPEEEPVPAEGQTTETPPETPPELVSEEDEFAAAFEERYGKEEEPPLEESERGQAQGTEDGEEGTPTTPVEGTESVPAPAEGQTLPVEGEGTPVQPVEGKLELPDGSHIDRPAWWKEATPEVQEHFDQTTREIHQLNFQYSAVHGRLAPVQQENTRLRAQLETMQAQLAGAQPAATPGDGGQSQPAATPSKDLQQSREFAEFAEAFPDEARAIEAMVGAKTTELAELRHEVANLKSGLTTVQQASTQQNREVEVDRLTTAHPDWGVVNESEHYRNWLGSQPESIRALASSPRADDCIWVLDAYKQAVYLSNLTAETEPAPDPAATRTQERRAQLRQTPPSPTPQPSGVSIPRGNPEAGMSDEDLFAAEAARRARAQR